MKLQQKKSKVYSEGESVKDINIFEAEPTAIIDEIKRAMNEPPYPAMPWITRSGINPDLLAMAIIQENPDFVVVTDSEPRVYRREVDGSFVRVHDIEILRLIRGKIPTGKATATLLREVKRLLLATIPASTTRVEAEGEPVERFIRAECIRSGNKHDRVLRSEFNRRFVAFCRTNRIEPIPKTEIKKRCERLGHPIVKSSSQFICGIAWKGEDN
jgi:hypothetical protein